MIPKKFDEYWRAACKIVLKEDIGAIGIYEPWLNEITDPKMIKESSVSKKGVVYTEVDYSAGSKWLSLSEVDYGKQYPKADLSGCNSIESLLEKIRGCIFYAGDIVLGKSQDIHLCCTVLDCTSLYDCHRFVGSKNCAFGYYAIKCEDVFGVSATGESKLQIRCGESTWNKRCFETWMCQSCSDCYYSFGLKNCIECMFCFNLQNRKYCIGNKQYGKEKYLTIKSRILSEVAEKLKKNKKIESLIDIIKKSKKEPIKLDINKREITYSFDKRIPDADFSKCCKIVLGKSLGGSIDDYGEWLNLHVQPTIDCFSAFSKKKMHLATYGVYKRLPLDRLLTTAEALAHADQVSANLEGAEFDKIHEHLGAIAYLNAELIDGDNMNIGECSVIQHATNAYRTSAAVYCKDVAFSFWPRHSSFMFGCDSIHTSSYCINCYNSQRLTRCFELDGCSDCSDCLFCHNVENCSDCMFCFNVKAKRYSIGNVEYQKDEYLRIKSLVLGEVSNKLEKNKKLDISIFNIGAKK